MPVSCERSLSLNLKTKPANILEKEVDKLPENLNLSLILFFFQVIPLGLKSLKEKNMV